MVVVGWVYVIGSLVWLTALSVALFDVRRELRFMSETTAKMAYGSDAPSIIRRVRREVDPAAGIKAQQGEPLPPGWQKGPSSTR